PGNWGFACCVVFPRVRKRASRRSRTSQCRVESCKGTPKNLLAVLAPLAILASFWEPTKALLGEILRARRGVGGRARRRHVFGRAACAFACGEARAQCGVLADDAGGFGRARHRAARYFDHYGGRLRRSPRVWTGADCAVFGGPRLQGRADC